MTVFYDQADGHDYNTSSLQAEINNRIGNLDALDAGIHVVGIARCLRAKAPVFDIDQILSEAESTGLQRNNDVKKGIDTALNDFWLVDFDFLQQLKVEGLYTRPRQLGFLL
jgi:hypothetical protein